MRSNQNKKLFDVLAVLLYIFLFMAGVSFVSMANLCSPVYSVVNGAIVVSLTMITRRILTKYE